MRRVFKVKMIFAIVFVVSLPLNAFFAWSSEPVVIPTTTPPETGGFLKYKPNAQQKDDTYQYLNKLDNPNANMDTTVKNYISGKSRAEQMVGMLQNQELTKAFEKITNNGIKTINENPEIKTPLGVIAGAASLWYGRTVNLIKGDQFKFSARMVARDQRSEFSMSSPLLNGRLHFDAREGMGLGFNRSIATIQTDASVQYNSKNQTISTEVRKKLAPNLDFSFGASRQDQNTKIEYRLNF